MIDLKPFIAGPLADAYLILPEKLDSLAASVMVLATCLQESGFLHRVQLGNGPAHGFAQMELGKPGNGAGVTGICEHPSTRDMVRTLCQARDLDFSPIAIWNAIINDDVLALGMARLGYYTNARPFPAVGDKDGAYAYYIGTWHPGKPRPETWAANYQAALSALQGAS